MWASLGLYSTHTRGDAGLMTMSGLFGFSVNTMQNELTVHKFHTNYLESLKTKFKLAFPLMHHNLDHIKCLMVESTDHNLHCTFMSLFKNI